MAQFVEERWQDVSGEEEGIKKMAEEQFGMIYASQVGHGIFCVSVYLCLRYCTSVDVISVRLQQVSTPIL